jgi:elongation factor G
LIVRNPYDDEPFTALAFKIITDPFIGKLTFVRIYSGSLKVGQSVQNTSTDKKEKILKIMKIYANKRDEISEAFAGDIITIPGLKFTKTGDTLCDINNPLLYEKISFSEPVINQAIEARTIADQDKLLDTLQKLSDELHLEIIVDRLNREFKIPAKVGKPQVSYRETIGETVVEEAVFERQLANKNQYGHIKIQILPGERNEGLLIENNLKKSKIPENLVTALEQGVREALNIGPNGYPMIDVKVRILESDYILDTTTEIGCKIAASTAVKEACRKAKPVMLEPVFKVDVTSPEEYVGDIIADINSRRGRVEGIESVLSMQLIRAQAPLSELFGYVTQLRSKSQGRAVFTMTFSHYEPAVIKSYY